MEAETFVKTLRQAFKAIHFLKPERWWQYDLVTKFKLCIVVNYWLVSGHAGTNYASTVIQACTHSLVVQGNINAS